MYNKNPYPGDRPHNQILVGSPSHPLWFNIERRITVKDNYNIRTLQGRWAFVGQGKWNPLMKTKIN